MAGQCRAGQNQSTARSTTAWLRRVVAVSIAQRPPQAQCGAENHDARHAGDDRAGRQHRDGGPRPGRPRLAAGSSCRPSPVRHHAIKANSGSSASPPARPARYSELGAKVSVMVPDVPAGTTQPCCHPLTVNGVSRAPVLVRATQPA